MRGNRLLKRTFTTDKYSINLNFSKNPQADIKTKLFESSLEFVPEYGFSKHSLIKGAEKLQLNPIMNGIVKRGPIELVEHFIEKSTDSLKDYTQNEFQEMKTTAKIRHLVANRLMMTAPFIEHWPEAVKMMAMPQNAPYTIKQLQEMVDEMWFLAGDKSVDLNWYSKRMLLAGVYTSTELFMTTDKSLEFSNTMSFLDDRLRDVGRVGRGIGQMKQFCGFTAGQVIGIMKSKRLF